MAEETKPAEKAADPKTKKKRPPKPVVVYHVHNLTRDVSTRVQRAQAPTRPRFKQYLGGGLLRLVRKRPTPITEDLLKRLLPEVVQKEKEGILKVTTPAGVRIDLSTLKPAEEPPAEPPKPQPPQDSVENDKTFPEGVGNVVPQVEGGVPQDAELEVPAAMRQIPEGQDEDEVEVEAAEDIGASVEEVAQALYDAHTKATLVEIAEGRGVDTGGNKMEVATRLAIDGYKG
jgi:hypothetical protein